MDALPELLLNRVIDNGPGAPGSLLCGDDVDRAASAGGLRALARPAVQTKLVLGFADGFDHVVHRLVTQRRDPEVLADHLGLEGDEKAGVDVVRKSLVEPLRWIAENGGEAGYVITSKVAEMEVGHGYNARTGVYENLVEHGVIDPVKVTRSALANAASIASLLLTTETLVVDKRDDES